MKLDDQQRRKLENFKTSPQRRSITIDSRALAIDEDKRTIRVAFSSEAEVSRWFGLEVLGHRSSEINLDRLSDGAAVLVNHEIADHIGVVESVKVTGTIGRAVLRFGSSTRAVEVFQNIVDGIWRHVSVGYFIKDMVLERETDDGPSVYRVTDWEPYEISLVAVPADVSVGLGRSKSTSFNLENNMPDNTESASRSQKRSVNIGRDLERERVDELLSIGQVYGAEEWAREAIRNGDSVHELNQRILDRGSLQVTTVEDPNIGMSRAEIGEYSISKAILAAAYPNERQYQEQAGLEIEVSEAARRDLHKQAKGNLYIPHDVLTRPSEQRNLTVGTAASGGNLVATDLLGGSFVDLLRNQSVVQSAGATVLQGLQGHVAIPRHIGAESTFWLAENAAPTESSSTFDQIPLTPKTVGAYTEISRKLLLQSTIGAESLVLGSLSQTLAIEIDRVAINGSGSGSEPIGILNLAGVGLVPGGTNGAVPTRADIIGLESAVSVPNALVGSLAYVTNAAAVGRLKQVLIDPGSGNHLLEGRMDNGQQSLMMNGYKSLMSNNVPANLTKGTGSNLSAILFGNWTDLLIGMWSGLDLQVNPYSLDTIGAIRITAFQDIDIQIRHAQSFAIMNDVITV